MYFRSSKKTNAEVSLEDPIGKDKDDNTITLQDVLENNDRNIEDEVDLKIKIKKLYEKIKDVLKDREKLIIELRFGLDGRKPKTQNQIAEMLRNFTFLCIKNWNKSNRKISKRDGRLEKNGNIWKDLGRVQNFPFTNEIYIRKKFYKKVWQI